MKRSLKKTVIFKVDPEDPDKRIVLIAARAVKSGKLVAFPTETVYGIAANRLDERAVRSLSRIKKRPKGKPFTVHISNVRMLKDMGCRLAGDAKVLADKFWPGPLTMVLKPGKGRPIGFRMPANKVALQLIDRSGVPVVAPSANLSGNAAPKDAASVLRDLDGKIDILLDAGRTDIGMESTVIDLTAEPPRILREGAISRIKLSKFIRGL